MKSPIYVLAVAVVVAFAYWAYTVNYATRDALSRVSELNQLIEQEREAIAVLHVEWAWLNRPERLEALVAQYNTTLGLMPLDPAHFGDPAQVIFRDQDGYSAPFVLAAPNPDSPMLPMTLAEVAALGRSR